MTPLGVSWRLTLRPGNPSLRATGSGHPGPRRKASRMKLVKLLILAVLVASAGGIAGQGSATRPPPAHGGILLRLHDQVGRTTAVTVQAGGYASIAAPGLPMLRLKPTMRPDGLLGIAVSIVTDEDARTGASTATTETTVNLGGTSHVEEAGYVLDIEWVDAWPAVAPLPSSGGQSECCVVCGGIKTCACRVQAPCGSCCDEECGGCTTPSPSAPTTVWPRMVTPEAAVDHGCGRPSLARAGSGGSVKPR